MIAAEWYEREKHVPPLPGQLELFPRPRKPRSCNRHKDCDEADAKEKARTGKDRVSLNFHCHDEDCEDCFGK